MDYNNVYDDKGPSFKDQQHLYKDGNSEINVSRDLSLLNDLLHG